MTRALALALALVATACGARTAVHGGGVDARLGTVDAGTGDAGRADSGTGDAGAADSGAADASPANTGRTDAAVDAPSCGPVSTLPVQLLRTETMRTTTLRTDVHIETTEWEPTPTIIAESWTWLERGPTDTLALSHDAAGTANWWVDNFILFEVFDCEGARIDAAFIGFTNGEAVTLDGVRVPQIGADAFEFRPREVSLASIVPVGVPVHLHATALDYGSWVSLGDLWALAR